MLPGPKDKPVEFNRISRAVIEATRESTAATALLLYDVEGHPEGCSINEEIQHQMLRSSMLFERGGIASMHNENNDPVKIAAGMAIVLADCLRRLLPILPPGTQQTVRRAFEGIELDCELYAQVD